MNTEEKEEFKIEFPADITIKEWKRISKIKEREIILFELHKLFKPDTQVLLAEIEEKIGYLESNSILSYFNLNYKND